jgi:hypothetical protein
LKARFVQFQDSCERAPWLISRRADFWLACGGASVGILGAIGLILLRGDRELDTLDFLLSEFHLGATYYTVLHRRLWRRLPADVLLVPALILALTYALSMSGQTILLASLAMYGAIWHRGRQSLGLARFYQRSAGGPASRTHNYLLQGAVYLPMLAALLAYTHLAPLEYEGELYLALDLGAEITSIVTFAATGWVIAYFVWTFSPNRFEGFTKRLTKKASEWFEKRGTNEKCSIALASLALSPSLSNSERRVVQLPAAATQGQSPVIHPGECWAVLAHVVAFGSGYVLGAANASFLLVLAVHHEVQYLYFAYAMSRRAVRDQKATKNETRRAMSGSYGTALPEREDGFRSELRHAAYFVVWPVIGFGGAVGGSWLALEWFAPLGVGGLFCHYWLDGRIWTRRALAT